MSGTFNFNLPLFPIQTVKSTFDNKTQNSVHFTHVYLKINFRSLVYVLMWSFQYILHVISW